MRNISTARRAIAVAAIGIIVGEGVLTGEGNWTQWRGPNRDGVVGGKAWPTSLSEAALKQSWRVELGEGYPGPIVSGDRVFTVESVDKKSEMVRAFDRHSGEEIWRHTWKGGMKVPFFAAKNGSWVRSTPATDGDVLVVGGMQEMLLALNVVDGSERWRLDCAEHFGSERPSFGFVCSPLIDDDAVYVQAGGGIAKLALKSGEVIWHVGGKGSGMNDGAFSSPILTSVNGQEQLIVQGRSALRGVDPKSGKTIWEQNVKAFRGMNIVTPVPFSNGFFTTAYGGRSKFWAVDNAGGGFVVENEWDNKLQGYMSTPVVVDGHAYFHLRNQRAACVDLESGEIAWVTDDKFGKYWSLVAQGDRLLALDERGELILFKANPKEFEVLDRRKISESETWGHLTAVDGQLFVRELNGLSAWEWENGSSLALSK